MHLFAWDPPRRVPRVPALCLGEPCGRGSRGQLSRWGMASDAEGKETGALGMNKGEEEPETPEPLSPRRLCAAQP